MALGSTVRIDHKGRVTLPKDVREAMGVGAGDTLSLRYEPEGKLIRLGRVVEDPIAVLWKYAEEEYRAGRTKDLRDYMREQGLDDV